MVSQFEVYSKPNFIRYSKDVTVTQDQTTGRFIVSIPDDSYVVYRDPAYGIEKRIKDRSSGRRKRFSVSLFPSIDATTPVVNVNKNTRDNRDGEPGRIIFDDKNRVYGRLTY